MSRCDFCTSACAVVHAFVSKTFAAAETQECHGITQGVPVQLDERQDGEAIQDYLNQLTGGRSVPRVFVAGKFIGGGDDTVAKQQSGELKKILQQAGAL